MLHAVLGFESAIGRWHKLDLQLKSYAVAMTATPHTVTDEQVASLREALGCRALVELTVIVAVENQRSRLTFAAGLTSQGFSDVCASPLSEAPSFLL